MIKNVPKCPECGSEKIVIIIYGIPGHGLLESSHKGEVMLG